MKYYLLFVSFLFAVALINPTIAKQWTVGSWTGSDFLDEKGKFTHCGAGTQSDSDLLTLTVHRGGTIFLHVQSPSFAFNQGPVNTFYSADGGPMINLPTLALRSNAVTAQIGPNKKNLLEILNTTKKITFYVEGDYTQVFTSPGIKVISNIFNCYIKYEPPTEEEIRELQKEKR